MIAPVANHFLAYILFILVTVAIWQVINVFITTPYFIYSVYFAPGGVGFKKFLSDHYRDGVALPQGSRVALDIASAAIYSYFFLDGRYDLVLGWLAILTAFDFLNVQLVTPEIIRGLEETIGRPNTRQITLTILGNGANSVLLVRLLHTAYFLGATMLLQRIFLH